MYKHCTTEKAALQQRRLEECLLSAMQEKSLTEITVSSLCEQTGLSRKTFYRLFESRQDVLDSLMDRTLREYIRFSLPQHRIAPGISPELQSFYYYWVERRALLDALSKNGLSTMLFERSIRHMLREETDVLQQLGFMPALQGNEEALMFFLSGILALLVGWHHGGYQKSPVQMAAITEKLLSEPLVRFL